MISDKITQERSGLTRMSLLREKMSGDIPFLILNTIDADFGACTIPVPQQPGSAG